MPRPSGASADQVLDVEGGLAEEVVGALFLQHQQAALDGAGRGGRDVAVLGRQFLAAARDLGDHRAQIFQVEQRQVLVRRDAEHDVEDAFLDFVEFEQAGEQQRPHVLHGRADGMALLAEDVPEHDGEGGVGVVLEADLLGALGQERLRLALRRDAGEVAFHVGGEDGDAGCRKTLGEHLQRHGLAGAGGAGDEAVAVGEPQHQAFVAAALVGVAVADVDQAVLKLRRRAGHARISARAVPIRRIGQVPRDRMGCVAMQRKRRFGLNGRCE